MKTLTVLACALTLAACGFSEIPASLIPDDESGFARDYLQRLRNGDIEYVKTYLDPALADQVDDRALRDMAAYFPSGEPLSVQIIGVQTHTSGSAWEGNFTFEYRFPDDWAVANAALRRVGDTTTVIGLNVYRTEASQAELTAFSAAPLSVSRVIALALTFASPVFMVITCYFVYRTPISKRKWLWYLLSFAGIGNFSLNWTTGMLSVQPLYVNLIGFGATAAGAAAPWIFSFTLPVGAVIFWARRNRLASPGKLTEDNAPQR